MVKKKAQAEADPPPHVEVYKRTDGTWAWRARDPGNRRIMGTDGGQGYEKRGDAISALVQVIRPDAEVFQDEPGFGGKRLGTVEELS